MSWIHPKRLLHAWIEVFSKFLVAILGAAVPIASFFHEAIVFISDGVASQERSAYPRVANSISAGAEEIFEERCSRCCV